jgi:5,10-methylene-tetrahydrofolate dehydrogenase/methenyl tetrahydrofolate cyclohydrolase
LNWSFIDSNCPYGCRGRNLGEYLFGVDALGSVSERWLAEIAREGEILVVAMGQRQAIGVDHIRPGAVVIDVGIHQVPDPAPGAPRFVGDVDFEAAKGVASAVTPVPGGVGPMTVAMILRNLIDAAEAAASPA